MRSDAPILAVTTFNHRGFEEYGHRCIETFKNWPKGSRLLVYADGVKVDPSERIEVRDLATSCPSLRSFKNRFKEYRPKSWEFDVVKFSHKVFAAVHGLTDWTGLGVWLDADCVTYNEIPDGYLQSLIPDNRYMAFFGRQRMYTETGFWMVDCAHSRHKDFMTEFVKFYTSGEIVKMPQWHDCVAIDHVRRNFESEGLRNQNLTKSLEIGIEGGSEKEMHPMAFSELGKYIDHCKGNRKKNGFSPENRIRAEV